MPNKVLEISILSWGSFMAQKKSGLRNVNLFCCRKMNYYNMIGGVIFWMCGQVSELFSPTECPRRQRMIFFCKKAWFTEHLISYATATLSPGKL